MPAADTVADVLKYTPVLEMIFPAVTLPVADTRPVVVKLPPVTLPVAVINPAVPKLPTLALPVPVLRVPATLTPVPVTTRVLLLTADNVMFAFVVIEMFELPLATVAMIFPAVTLPVPVIWPEPKPKLPTLALPVPVLKVPATLTPVPVTTRIFALPTAEILTLPFAAGILTFELPFARGPIRLPALMLPVPVLKVPATLTPVPVTTRIFALPTAEILTLPFAAGILTFELPFEKAPVK